MINNNTPQTISGKIKTRTPTQAEALSSRYVFLNLNNAEPNLGTPKSPGIKQEYLGDDGYRYLLLSNNTSSLSAWRVWSFDNPRIAAYSKENSIALGDNANPINNNSIVYNNHPYGTNAYNSQSFRDNSFNVFSLSGIYLFDATTIGDPASATAFVVTDDGKVGINTNSPAEALSIVGNVSATGNLTINTNATLGKGKTSTNILRGTVKIADSSPSSVVFGVSDANYDTNLYRGGANILKTDDLFVCDSLSAMGTISTTNNGNSNQWNSNYTTTNSNSANWILQNGNSFGGAMVIGTNDSNSLSVRTNGAQRLLITNTNHRFDGNVSMGTGVDSSERLTVNGNISANGTITASGGNSNQWNAAYNNYATTYPTLTSFYYSPLNLLGAINTNINLFTVPSGKIFITKTFTTLVIDSAGTASASPVIRVSNASRNSLAMTNNNTLPTSNCVIGGSTIAQNTGNTTASGGEIVALRLTTAATGSTTLSASAILEGFLI